jgi:hypothetical protein
MRHGDHEVTAPGGRDGAVRRALKGGSGVALLAGGGLAWCFGAAGGVSTGVVGAMLGLVAGLVVASAWLLLAVALDLLAGAPPDRRRILWTAALTFAALASPILVLAAGL